MTALHLTRSNDPGDRRVTIQIPSKPTNPADIDGWFEQAKEIVGTALRVLFGGGSIRNDYFFMQESDPMSGDDDYDECICCCQMCGWTGPAKALGCQVWDVYHLFERVPPGEEMPVGECPECGALANYEDPSSVNRLFNVACDEPWGDGRPDEHDRDAVYLIWMDGLDLERLKRDLGGRVSFWAAGITSLQDYIKEAKRMLDDPPQ